MSKTRKQQILLAVLGAILVIALGWQVGSVFSAGGFGNQKGRPSSSRKGDGLGDWEEKLPRVEELQLDRLLEGQQALAEGRDPFQIRPPETARRPDPSVEAARKAMRDERQREKIETVPAVVPARPTPPPVDVVFLGSFGSERNRLAVFSDGKKIFNVFQGHVLKDKFVVMRIGFESADLGFVGFPDAPAQRLEIGG